MLLYFFVAGHHHYACYITHQILEMRHLLPPEAKTELMSGAFVSRHQEGSWNGVSLDLVTSLVNKLPFESAKVASRVDDPFLKRWSRNG